MSAATLRPTASAAAPTVRPAARMGRAPAPLLLWLGRIRARRALAALHPEQIREAGLDPSAVRAECLKPFWRA